MEIIKVLKDKIALATFISATILFYFLYTQYLNIEILTIRIIYWVLLFLISLNLACFVFKIKSLRNIKNLEKKSLLSIISFYLIGYTSTQFCVVGFCSPGLILPLLTSTFSINLFSSSNLIAHFLALISVIIATISLYLMECFKRRQKIEISLKFSK